MSYVILNQNLDVCGVLDLNGQGCKFYDDVRSTKVADEQGKIWSDTLQISVPYGYDETDYITQGHHLLKEGTDGYTYCYRIFNWVDSAIGNTHVKKALGINLLAWDLTHKIVPAAKFPLANSQDVFTHITQGSGWEINENSFFGDSRLVDFTAGQNAMYWLDQQIANFGVEIRAYVEVYNGKIIRKLIDIVEKLGESNNYRLDYAHDLQGLSRTGDESQLFTKLYVYGGNDANNKPISIASVNGGKDFIVDDEANDAYNNSSNEYLEGYITNQDITDPGGLLVWGRQQLNKYNHPRYSYAVDVAYLGFMPNLGDNFQVVDFSMEPELTIAARAIQLDESEATPSNNKIVVGEFIEVIVVTPSDVRKLIADAQKTADSLANAIALKNTFFRQDTEPTEATQGDYWIYTGTDPEIPVIQQLQPDGTWIEVNELKGNIGETGQPGADGRTSYLHIAYADDENGGGFSQSPTDKSYMGTYVDYNQIDSTNPDNYTWIKIQGPQGPAGLQGLQGPKGDQGIEGPKGIDGLSSYTHIAYATSADGSTGFSVSNSVGATYIGMYVDTVATDSTNPNSYKWSLIKGADGPQGIQGPAGPDGRTPYFHIAYALNDTGSVGFSVTDSANKTYMGTYTDFTATDSTDPTKYKWVKIQGPQGSQGPQGLQGVQGPKGDQGLQGPNGTSSYTHIAYAQNSTGTLGFSTSGDGAATYIGMYVDNTLQDSTDPTKYKWNLIKGADGTQGVQGPKGDDGLTPYLHIAYATNATGTTGFSTTDATGKTYIGTYTDYTQNDSTDPSKYTWALIQGPRGLDGPQGPIGLQGVQGPQGDQGIQGAAGASSYTHIAYANNDTGTSGFSVSDSTAKSHIGIYVDNVSQDSTDPSKYKWTLIKGADGSQGIQGTRGADGLTPYFHIAYSQSADGVTGFSTTSPTNATYIGTYTDYTAADSTAPSMYTWAKIQGPQGPQGQQGSAGPQGLQGLQGPKGDQGLQGPAGTSSYTHIAYATNSTGTTGFSLSGSAGASYIGMYVDSVAQDSTDPTKYKWSLIKGADGAQGVQGPTGADGLTPYLHIAYATNATGTTGFSTTDATGKTYIGTYTDYSQNDSTDPTKYTWALIQGPQGPQGQTGQQGPAGTSSYVYVRYSANADGSGMTTTAQSNTAYIGIAVTTTPNSAPTATTAYSWSLFKGPQGSQGVQGPTGADGQPTYTWVKYAIDELGGNMGDTPDGKRYIGLAFNKTTATESGLASDYQWSPLYDNVVVGSKNILLNSSLHENANGWSGSPTFTTVDGFDTAQFTGALGTTNNLSQSILGKVLVGKEYTMSGWVKVDSIVKGTTNYTIMFYADGQYDNAGVSTWFGMGSKEIDVTKVGWQYVTWTFTIPEQYSSATSANMMMYTRDFTGNVYFRDFKFEKGNIATDWTPAIEDWNAELNNKATGSDLDALAGSVSLISSQLNGKTDYGEFKAMKEDYDAFIAQNIVDAKAVTDDLATIEGRVTLAETLAGNSKLVTDFISTVITESEEGIYISNGASNTGILISTDRISFMDNDVEVAYISNQTMQINHGIFVESAIISDFKFEKIPGTTILAITWVGD